jgi:hypothetical protein
MSNLIDEIRAAREELRRRLDHGPDGRTQA